MNNEVQTQLRHRRLTESQEELLALVNKKKSVTIDEVSEMMEDVKNLISEGYLQLAVSIYAWGAEFEVRSTSDGALLVEPGER